MDGMMKHRLQRVVLACVSLLGLQMAVHAAEPIRVAYIGDSITFGSGVQGRETNSYPAG